MTITVQNLNNIAKQCLKNTSKLATQLSIDGVPSCVLYNLTISNLILQEKIKIIINN